jgi:flagellar basal body-associated protein FliL
MKKVTLDLLEEFPNPEKEHLNIAVDISEAEQISWEQEENEESLESPKVGRQWAFNKLLFIAAPLVLAVVAVSGSLMFFFIKQTSPVFQTHTKASEKKTVIAHRAAIPAKTGEGQQAVSRPDVSPGTLKVVYLKDFIIDLKDSQGKSFVLMCDVAFDVGGHTEQGLLENNAAIRNIIYKTAQSRNVVALRSVEERKKMKMELVSALEKILGEGSVKNLYFMNYFIM